MVSAVCVVERVNIQTQDPATLRRGVRGGHEDNGAFEIRDICGSHRDERANILLLPRLVVVSEEAEPWHAGVWVNNCGRGTGATKVK